MVALSPKRTVVLAKIESTYNTDSVPVAATDAVKCTNPQIAPVNLRLHQLMETKPSYSKQPRIFGGRLFQVTLEVYLKGSGTAGTPPEYGPLLRACGWSETIVPVTSVTYAPVTPGAESCTIYYFKDGKRYAVTGCRGTFTATIEDGVPARLLFTMTGHCTGPTDVALPSPTYQATAPVAAINLASLAVDGYTAPVSAINFDSGNVIEPFDNITEVDGYGEVNIGDRDVVGSLDPVEVLNATYDWDAKFKADTVAAFDTGTVGGTGGNIWRVQMPQLGYLDVVPSERQGVCSLDVPFYAAENAGDDEVSLAFT